MNAVVQCFFRGNTLPLAKPNCYTSHPSGLTDSHIAGCRITLSQQDRNEHNDRLFVTARNIYSTRNFNFPPSTLFGTLQYRPPFLHREFVLSSSTFMLQISCLINLPDVLLLRLGYVVGWSADK